MQRGCEAVGRFVRMQPEPHFLVVHDVSEKQILTDASCLHDWFVLGRHHIQVHTFELIWIQNCLKRWPCCEQDLVHDHHVNILAASEDLRKSGVCSGNADRPSSDTQPTGLYGPPSMPVLVDYQRWCAKDLSI